MNPIKLPEEIITEAKKLKVTTIKLSFEGGSDEGYLSVLLNENYSPNAALQDLSTKIEEWAWDNYYYSGAGDGNRYGDTIVYNLAKGVVEVNEWYQVVKTTEVEKFEMDSLSTEEE